MKIEITEAVPFCHYNWGPDDDPHDCCLDLGHEGEHVCGHCSEGYGHKDNPYPDSE